MKTLRKAARILADNFVKDEKMPQILEALWRAGMLSDEAEYAEIWNKAAAAANDYGVSADRAGRAAVNARIISAIADVLGDISAAVEAHMKASGGPSVHPMFQD